MDMRMEPLDNYSIGIDPGWVNMGCATVKEVSPFKFEILYSGTWDPSKALTENQIKFAVSAMLKPIPYNAGGNVDLMPVAIERYVSYGNIRSTHGEEILMVIGMLRMELFNRRGMAEPIMLKAIDWKTKLCQTLVRHTGFDNPSKKGLLDKEFSVAAAKHLTSNNELISDDHQADAICLAAYPQVLVHAKQAKAANSSGSAPSSQP